MSDSEQVKILKEQLQQANNLINQLVASNNALAASAVAGAGAATGAAGAAVTGVATGVPMANATAFPMANATAIPSMNPMANAAAISSMNPMAQNTQLPGVTLDDCSKTKGFMQKQMCEAKNKAKAMAGQAVGQASGMAKDAAFGFAKNKWDQNKDDIMAKGASAGMSALSSAGSQFKNITGMAAKEQKKKIKDIILPFYENDGPLKQWLDKWSNNFRERVKTYIEKENFKKNITEALNDGLLFISEEEADEFDKIKLGEKRLRDDLEQDDVNFYFEKLKVESTNNDKSWMILNLANDIWREFVKADPSKMQQLSASTSSMKDLATKKAEGMKFSLSDATKKAEVMKSSLSDAAQKAEGMKSSLSDAATKKAEGMKSSLSDAATKAEGSLPSKEEVEKKINEFLAGTRQKFTEAKTKYNSMRQAFNKKVEERKAINEERKQQQLKIKQALEEAKMAQEKQAKEAAISKLKMQLQSFEESIKQKDVEKTNIEQSKSEFQKTIEEKNTIITETIDKKCTGMLSKMGFGLRRCKAAREEDRKKILASIDQIKQDIIKADEEIADIDNKKSEFTKMIEDANEELKKLEGQPMQGGRKKRSRKKRTKKKSRKRKGRRTRKKN